MASKIFLYLALLFALVLLVSSEVAAKDLAQTVNDEKKVEANPNAIDDAKYRDDHGYPGRGGGRGRDYPPRGGRRCYHGCCKRSYNGFDCLRCCSYAGQALGAQKPHN